MGSLHKQLSPFGREFDTEVDREAAELFWDDVGCLALQKSDNSVWVVIGDLSWSRVGGWGRLGIAYAPYIPLSCGPVLGCCSSDWSCEYCESLCDHRDKRCHNCGAPRKG